MTTYNVNSGVVSSGIVLSGGDVMNVSGGGTAEFTVVNSGGFVTVSSGGLASASVVSGGGTQTVLGTASGTLVQGGFEIVSAGGVANFTVVSNGAENVGFGGFVNGLMLGEGGNEFVFAGGTASATSVGAGGTENVESEGVASGSMVGSGGTEFVQNGGTVNGVMVFAGGTQLANVGAVVSGTVLSSGGTETIRGSEVVVGTVINLGGIIDLTDLVFSSGASAAFNSSTDVLTVTDGGTQYTQTLAGTYSNVSFQTTSDGGGGTQVTMACFVTGTRIATDHGEVAVEALRIGDQVALADGRISPIVWLGYRRVDCTRHPKPEQVMPVRVLRDAFGPGVPTRDLFMSPDHAVFAEGVLIPVRHLINGGSVAQVKVAEVTYYHVELGEHEVLLAEGMAAESYLDTGDRSKFENGGAAMTLHPNFSSRVWEGMGCAQLVVSGREIEAVRRLLAERVEAACQEISEASAVHQRASAFTPKVRLAARGR
jgi:autotransporter passenger strand-loop-strand repeat protein